MSARLHPESLHSGKKRMELDILVIFLLCLVYFCSGFIDSIAGGGGLLATPAFLLAGVPPDAVLGTNKMIASLGTASSLITYARSGMVLWKLAAVGLPASLLGGFMGTRTLLLFSNASIGKIIVILLPFGIIATLAPKKLSKDTTSELTPLQLYVLTPLICWAVSFYAGFFGPGSGSFFILALHYGLGLGLVQAAGSNKLFNLASSVGALYVFILNGKVLFSLVLPMAACCIAGNILGSTAAVRTGSDLVRKVLRFSLSLLFISLVWKFFLRG